MEIITKLIPFIHPKTERGYVRQQITAVECNSSDTGFKKSIRRYGVVDGTTDRSPEILLFDIFLSLSSP